VVGLPAYLPRKKKLQSKGASVALHHHSASQDGGPATSAFLQGPRIAKINPFTKDLYIPDQDGNSVRRVDGTTSIITTIAGSGKAGSYWEGCDSENILATSAHLIQEHAVQFDPDTYDILYIVDHYHHAIRRLDLRTGLITTVAGTLCSAGCSGDGGLATSATLFRPADIVFDSETRDMYIADEWNHAIRRVDGATGVIETFAGILGRDEFFGDGGQASEAGVPRPCHLMIHPITKDLWISEYGPNVVRRISRSTGIITTPAGVPCQPGKGGDGGPAENAQLYHPIMTTYDPVTGGILISDGSNGAVRLLTEQ